MSSFYSENELISMKFKKIGNNVKISKMSRFYNCEEMELGDNVRIDDFSVISGKVKLGNNVHIANFCLVAGGEEGIEFKDFSGLAYRCTVFTRSDDYTGTTLTNPTIPEHFRSKTIKRPVVLGKHSIVGTGSTIMPGAHLSEGTSVGAHTMITKPTEEWSIYFGVPAKKIKNRKKDVLLQEEEYKNSNL